MDFWKKRTSRGPSLPWRENRQHDGENQDKQVNSPPAAAVRQRNKGASDVEEKYGLFVFKDMDPQEAKTVDIVAIHGLNGHYDKTWQSKTPSGDDVNWLRDFLPQQMPNARIMSYGYNSAILFSKSVADIGTFAGQLLEDLRSHRRAQEAASPLLTRPIIFICHSLGGIVFKKAIVRAHECERYSNILECVRGVAFFGTPHKGSELASWATIFGNILSAASLSSHIHAALSSHLKTRSEVLQEISRSFVERSKDLKIFSFFETDKMDYLNCRVVDEASAVLGLPNEIPIAMNGNHRSICRFSSIEEHRYRHVWTNLQDMALAAVTRTLSVEEKACHQELYTSDYETHKNRNPSRVPGTCQWFLDHEKYLHWRRSQESSLLWVSANPGCGKSVLASFLVDQFQNSKTTGLPETVCYFFFKDDAVEQKKAIYALNAILHQIYAAQPNLLRHALEESQEKGTSKTFTNFDALWRILMRTVRDKNSSNIICVIDGLDECEKVSQRQLMKSLVNLYKCQDDRLKEAPFFKVLITSRPDNSIKTALYQLPTIRLRGEDETEAIIKDIGLVIRASIDNFVQQGLPADLLTDLEAGLIKGADRTFLWTTLVISLLKDALERGASGRELIEILKTKDIYTIYRHLLHSSADPVAAKIMLQIVVAAGRPLTIDEMNNAFAIHASAILTAEGTLSDLKSELKYPFENYVKSLCGHFLRVIRSTIYLVHQTAREFLLTKPPDPSYGKDFLISSSQLGPWQHSIDLPEAHILLLEICVAFLVCLSSESEESTRLQLGLGYSEYCEGKPTHQLLNYATSYTSFHFCWIPARMDFLILDRCEALGTSQQVVPRSRRSTPLDASPSSGWQNFYVTAKLQRDALVELDGIVGLLSSIETAGLDSMTAGSQTLRDDFRELQALLKFMKRRLGEKSEALSVGSGSNGKAIIETRGRLADPNALVQPHTVSNAFERELSFRDYMNRAGVVKEPEVPNRLSHILGLSDEAEAD